MMAASGSNVVYARPIRLVKDTDRPQVYPKRSSDEPRKAKHVTIATPKSVRVIDIENSSPPPRPPPPRPARVPKHQQTEKSKHSSESVADFSHQQQTTPEPKPLTRTNVTSHDRLWKNIDDEDVGPSDVLSPPMKHITPETAEEMWKNFDPLDVIDSTSDHSDSSADTMIMMTTEEEKANQEKIDTSIREYQSRKSKPHIPNTNKLKVNIQSKKNMHIQFSDTNGFVNMPVPLTNGVTYPDSESMDSVSKVTPLHVRTTNESNGSSPESVNGKPNSQYSSPNDSPDDGYGTNSSTGTVSSPFSSSFNSDLENSCNGSMKKVILPNGAIKPNSVRESWAVKRKQRMIDAQDNSVQDQLRELAIIEEEGSGNSAQAQDRTILQQRVNRYGINVAGYSKNSVENKNESKSESVPGNLQVPPRRPARTDLQSNPHVVSVSHTDLSRQNGDLFVISSENDTPPHQRRSESARAPPHYSSANEINAPARVPPPYNTVMGSHRSRSAARVGDEQSGFSSWNGERQPERSREARLSRNGYDSGEFNSLPDSVNSAPLLRGGDRNHPTQLGSGKIYVSPSGDEGFYSLNRSSRSTSISSFDPLMEQTETPAETEAPGSPKSPLEMLSGDLLEKWTDMDRNYRNYYGFGGETEKYSRTDSKVNYFQEKKINRIYGQDNYYRPSTFGEEPHPGQGHVSGQSSGIQGTQRDLRTAGVSETDSASNRTSSMRSQKMSKEGSEKEKSKNKLFQILPNMFKPSSKKQNAELNKKKPKSGILKTNVSVQQQQQEVPASPEAEQDSEYMNIGDIPRNTMAHILQEEKLRRGEFVPLENLQKRPVFASSKDIQKLFSKQNQSFDSINSPGSQRHSFHAMPLSYRHVVPGASDEDEMRPRAQSTSATMRTQFKSSIENRMAVIAQKNAVVMNQAKQGGNLAAGSVGNLSVHSNSSNRLRTASSRARLNSSGSSGEDSKLSTLV